MSYVQAQLGVRATYVDTTKQLHDASETLRAPYLTEIYRAGRDFGSLSWWVTSVSYRNGIYSKTFHQACVLKLALDTVATWKAQEPLVLVAPTTVRKALKRNLGVVCSFLLSLFLPFNQCKQQTLKEKH